MKMILPYRILESSFFDNLDDQNIKKVLQILQLSLQNRQPEFGNISILIQKVLLSTCMDQLYSFLKSKFTIKFWKLISDPMTQGQKELANILGIKTKATEQRSQYPDIFNKFELGSPFQRSPFITGPKVEPGISFRINKSLDAIQISNRSNNNPKIFLEISLSDIINSWSIQKDRLNLSSELLDEVWKITYQNYKIQLTDLLKQHLKHIKPDNKKATRLIIDDHILPSIEKYKKIYPELIHDAMAECLKTVELTAAQLNYLRSELPELYKKLKEVKGNNAWGIDLQADAGEYGL